MNDYALDLLKPIETNFGMKILYVAATIEKQKVEVAVLGSPSLTVLTVSVDVKQH